MYLVLGWWIMLLACLTLPFNPHLFALPVGLSVLQFGAHMYNNRHKT